MGSLTHRIRHRPAPGSSVNYVRVPALLSGLLLLVFAPGILRRGGQAFGRASGLDQSPDLGRWLAITAVLFLGSAVVYAVRRGSRRPAHRPRPHSRSSTARMSRTACKVPRTVPVTLDRPVLGR